MLTTPYIVNLPLGAYDKKNEIKIYFQATQVGNDLVVANEVVVEDEVTRTQVYSNKINNFSFEHTIPANIFENGKEYRVKIRTYNFIGECSDWSNWETFHCFTKPTFIINNVSNFIEMNNFTFQGLYLQLEDEPLESFNFVLYDEYGYPIKVSDVRFNLNEMSFEVIGLMDEKNYSIEMKGETLHGMKITTGKIPFRVDVIKPATSLAMNVENVASEGHVKISSNILEVYGDSTNGNVSYYNDDYVDLRADGAMVEFENGFTLGNNFTLRLWGRNVSNGGVFLQLYDRDSGTAMGRLIEVSYFYGRFQVRKRMRNLSPYYIYSDEIYIGNDEDFYLYLECYDGRLSVKASKEVIV